MTDPEAPSESAGRPPDITSHTAPGADAGGTAPLASGAGAAPAPPAPPVSGAAPATPAPRPHRPAAVTIVALLLLIAATFWLVYALATLWSSGILLPGGGGLLDLSGWHFGSLAMVVAVRQVLALAVAFIAGVALLQMRRHAWLLAMIAAVISLAVQLMAWWDGQPNYVMLTLGVVVVLLMNQEEVRDAFRPGSLP